MYAATIVTTLYHRTILQLYNNKIDNRKSICYLANC